MFLRRVIVTAAAAVVLSVPSVASSQNAGKGPVPNVAAITAKYFPKGKLRPPAPHIIIDAQIDANIDASITGVPRSKLRAAMLKLRPQDRDNVTIVLPDGTIIANRAGLAAQTYAMRPVAGKANTFLDDQGHEVHTPALTAGPRRTSLRSPLRTLAFRSSPKLPFRSSPTMVAALSPPDATGGDTGPFHRVYSNVGYSFASANIDLPCYAGQMDPSYETGNVYLGGWGQTYSASDAGLFHSSVWDASVNDNWALLFKENHAAHSYSVSLTRRFKCGQTATLTFYAVNGDGTVTETNPSDPNTIIVDNMLVLNIQGTWNDGSAGSTSQIIYTPTTEWDASGAGDMIKRMTTIAQSPGQQTYNDGSWFGYDTNLGPYLNWSGAQIGNNGSGVPWTSLYTGGYQDWLIGGAGAPDLSTYVYATVTAADTDESDGINLHT